MLASLGEQVVQHPGVGVRQVAEQLVRELAVGLGEEGVGGGGDAVPQGPPPATGGLGRHLGGLHEAVAGEGHQVLAGAAHAHAELARELLGGGVAAAAQGVEHRPAPCRERRRRAGLVCRAHLDPITIP